MVDRDWMQNVLRLTFEFFTIHSEIRKSLALYREEDDPN